MIDINELYRAKEDDLGIEIWGFEREYRTGKKGSIVLNAITYPVMIQNIGFSINCFYADGLTIDNTTQTVIPVGREDVFKELFDDELKRSYGASYYPLHEFYFIPRPHILAYNQEYYDKMVKDLELFERIINDFFLTKEEAKIALCFFTSLLNVSVLFNKSIILLFSSSV